MGVQKLLPTLLAFGISAVAVGLSAQQSVSSGATPAQLETGKKLFVQRCSVCHLPPLGPGEPRPYARLLTGFVKDSDAKTAARLVIQMGVPTRMPGFRYGLEPSEIDGIVEYLSTLK